MTNQTVTSPATRYTFSVKEKDEETGYSVTSLRTVFSLQFGNLRTSSHCTHLLRRFGARYYNSDLSIWLSVDPMSDKYPNISPYVYCANNPVKLVDPDGMEITIPPWFILKTIARVVEYYSTNSDIKTVAYTINHPINAIKVKYDYNVAATNFQINIGKAINCPQNTDGSPQNAIRHTLWQALITRDYGAVQAERIGAAHEDNIPFNTNIRLFSSREEADEVVDLLNNEIGRRVGENNPSANNRDMAKYVMKEYYSAGLWTVKSNNNGSYTIEKTKISIKQYYAAINEINKKGENGLNQ